MSKKLAFGTLFLFAAATSYAYLALRVDNRITAPDVTAISELNVQDACGGEMKDFSKEVSCIAAIQFAVQAIGDGQCATKSDTVEPVEFLARNYGCCHDRARFIEKAARYYGFETRHVFIINPKVSSIGNVLPLGQSSHATSEILTSRGWLGVDSVDPYMLTDKSGRPMTYVQALNNSDSMTQTWPNGFYSRDLDVIYGLYSRHGSFHGADLPGPEFVFSELLYNFTRG